MPSPLTDEHLDKINQALATTKESRQTLMQAKQAGMDVGDIETALDETEKRLLATNRSFFPGR